MFLGAQKSGLSQKMYILLIAPQPFFTIRGTPMAVRELASAIGKLGHRVDILTFHLGDDIAVPGVRIIRTKAFSRVIKAIPPGFSFKKVLLDMALFPKALWLILRNRYDVVHCVEESAHFISWFRWLGSFLFIDDMDSNIPHQLEYSGKVTNRCVLRIVKTLDRIALARADAVVTICPVFTESVRSAFPDKPVFQIEDVSVSDEIAPREGPAEMRTVLYTGNFERYQGLDILLEGFRKVQGRWRDAALLIVGGEEGEVRAMKKRYDDPRIIFAGTKPVSEMPRFLQAADILVSPRVSGENTPYKIYSYLASGKAILATRIISHSQILTNREDALLVDPTAEGIAEGLNALLGEPDLARKIGAGGRKLFEARYSRQRYREKVGALVKFMEEHRR